MFSTISVFAEGWRTSDNIVLLGNSQIKLSPSFQASKGYNYGDYTFTKNYHMGEYGVYMPTASCSTEMEFNMRRYI